MLVSEDQSTSREKDGICAEPRVLATAVRVREAAPFPVLCGALLISPQKGDASPHRWWTWAVGLAQGYQGGEWQKVTTDMHCGVGREEPCRGHSTQPKEGATCISSPPSHFLKIAATLGRLGIEASWSSQPSPLPQPGKNGANPQRTGEWAGAPPR